MQSDSGGKEKPAMALASTLRASEFGRSEGLKAYSVIDHFIFVCFRPVKFCVTVV